MEPRKLQLVGNRSYAISLPKRWVTANNLKEKDTVFIDETPNNELIVRAADSGRDVHVLDVNADAVGALAEFIVFCYVKNVDKLRLRSKKFTYDKVTQARAVLKYLDGYDITHEDEKTIEISFLFNDFSITLPQILRRMTYLLRLMVDALADNDLHALSESENTTDRLYHLSRRIIFASARNQKLRLENHLRSEDDLFFMSEVVKKLENIADAMYALQSGGKKNVKKIHEYVDFLEAILHSNKSVSFPTPVDATHRIADLCRDIHENVLSMRFNATYF